MSWITQQFNINGYWENNTRELIALAKRDSGADALTTLQLMLYYEREEAWRGQLTAALLEAERPDATVVIEESGMDCDGVQYAGKLYSIEPNVEAYCKLRDDIAEWADGPFHLSIVPREWDVNDIHYRTRDRALEAFEDGHPGTLYTGPI